MNVYQPSLWDNVSLENGYRSLSLLKLEDAESQFTDALKSDIGERELIFEALESCRYWKERIPVNPIPKKDRKGGKRFGVTHKKLVEDYATYSFSAKLGGFKRALMRFLADAMIELRDFDIKEMERAFDLLLDIRESSKALELVTVLIQGSPGIREPIYHLAQAQWLSGEKIEAGLNYTKALLFQPERTAIHRIAHEQLRGIAESYGPELAPAYGWVRGIIPSVHLPDEMDYLNADHERAILAYRMMQSAHKSFKDNDKTSYLRKRKELMNLNPELYREYFMMISRSN